MGEMIQPLTTTELHAAHRRLRDWLTRSYQTRIAREYAGYVEVPEFFAGDLCAEVAL